ncbi:MAG TPA: PilZ domain-containing protein [Bryobacteraceae bacterium]|nr:PilZ domain-containing protein [Bryobacteraceae bacterium]
MRLVTKSIERRARTRFPMHRELRYKLLEGEATIASGAGATCDMSSGGVAFTTDRPLATGAFIEISISWPVVLDDGCPMRLIVFGKVLRSGLHRSACSVEKYEFRTQSRTLLFAVPSSHDSKLQRWAKEYTKARQASA